MDEKLLPIIRQHIAKILVNERGHSQSRAAELLGVTQAMVSKYISNPQKKLDHDLQEELERISIKLSSVLESPGEATRVLCAFCLSLRESEKLCPIHKGFADITECNACMNLRREDNPRNTVLHSMRQAIEVLIKENIVALIPQVRTNIAMATENPAGPVDVASLPGRLIKVRNRVMSPTVPEFNASKHTTRLLLHINSLQPNFRAIMNIKHSQQILTACKDIGFKEKILVRKDGKIIIDMIDSDCDCLIDDGAFGIEPCIYLLGEDAIDVANKAVQISRFLTR